MNASKILQQLMSQASGSKGSSGGMDVKGVIDGLSRHLGGNSSQGTRQSSGSSGFDVKSLLGGGALGILVGSKRGRSMGGKALKYGAIAGVGVLAWKAWQSSQEKKGAATQSSSEGERVEVLSGEVQERRSLELLQAMIMAARADGHIDEQEQALITDQQRAVQDSMVGREVQVLFEKPGRLEGQMVGKSEYLHAVHVAGAPVQRGDIGRVRIVESGPNSLAGELI